MHFKIDDHVDVVIDAHLKAFGDELFQGRPLGFRFLRTFFSQGQKVGTLEQVVLLDQGLGGVAGVLAQKKKMQLCTGEMRLQGAPCG